MWHAGITLKVKIFAGYVLLNGATLLMIFILAYDYAEPAASHGGALRTDLLIFPGFLNMAVTVG